MKCPKCGSENIGQYRHPRSRMWCEDCDFVLRDEGSETMNTFGPAPDVPCDQACEVVKDALISVAEMEEQCKKLHSEIGNRGSTIRTLVNGNSGMAATILELKKENQKLMLMSPSKICREFHLQNCHYCEDMKCGDNQSPAKRRIKELEKGE